MNGLLTQVNNLYWSKMEERASFIPVGAAPPTVPVPEIASGRAGRSQSGSPFALRSSPGVSDSFRNHDGISSRSFGIIEGVVSALDHVVHIRVLRRHERAADRHGD